MISGLFIQSRRRERGQGVVGSHMILWGKSLFFFSPQRLTKNIFKNYSLLLTQRFLLFPCETLLLQYAYSIRCTVQYMKGSTLYCTGLSSEQGLSTTANFSVPARWWMYNNKPHTVQQSPFLSFRVFFCTFFFLFFFFLTIKNSYEMWHPLDARTGKAIFYFIFFPQTHCKQQ